MAIPESPWTYGRCGATALKQESPLAAAGGSPQATATSTLGIAESMHQGPLCLLSLLLTVYQAQASQLLLGTVWAA